MRIKLVHIISSLEIGGAQSVLFDLITHLDKTAFEHRIIYFRGGPYEQKFRDAGMPIHSVSGLFFTYDPIFFIRLLWLFITIRPDCVHTLLWAANICGRFMGTLLKIPIVSVVHNQTSYQGAVRCKIDSYTLSKKSHFIAVSQHVKKSLLSQYPFLRDQHIGVIHNGVDIHRISQHAQRADIKRSDFGISEKDFIFGAVGRLDPVKNYDIFLKSFARLVQKQPHVRFVLIGTGPQESILRSQIKEYRLQKNAFLLGSKTAYGYYPLFDCFVLPSSNEGISIALLEAMSFGLPCIVTGHNLKHAVITHNYDGIIVKPHDVQQLYNTIEIMHDDNIFRKQLGTCAKKTVRMHWSSGIMVNMYARLFKEQRRSPLFKVK